MLRFPLIRQFLLIAAVVCLLLVIQNTASLTMVHAENESVRRWITWSSVAMLVLLIAAAFAYSRIVSLKLRKILRGMEAVRRGEYPRLLADRQDDIGDIIKGFNQMVEELRGRDEKLQSWATKAETQAEALAHTVEAEREKLGTVLDSIGEGVIVLDSDSKVLMSNWRVGEIFGVPMDALRQSDLRMLIEQVRHRLVKPEEVDRKLHDLQQNPELMGEITLELDEPGGQSIRLYCAPVRDNEGKLLGRIATSLDLGKERELERLKTEFISTVSHELRTPLTSIKGALGLIRGGAAGNVSPDMRELLEIAGTNTDRLIQVINDILDVVQLERGQARIRPISMSLRESVEHAMFAMASRAHAKNIVVESSIPGDLPAVKGDPKRVEQVLVNLISNAIKFSAPDQRVVISAKPEGDTVVVSVQDSGCGMSREFLSRLFSKFEHAQDSLTRDSQGAGLGLAICRHIVEAHGGQIWVDSQEGKGSTFYFSLHALDRDRQLLPINRRMAAHGKLVLVIEDDEDVARVISYVFESLGNRVLVARNGMEGIEMTKRHHPAMLTVDLMMPRVDGYQVLTELRQNPETKDIPIICISVEPDPREAMARGADYFIEKPIAIEKLREVAVKAMTAGGRA